MLEIERSKASFSVEDMKKYIHGTDYLDMMARILPVLENDVSFGFSARFEVPPAGATRSFLGPFRTFVDLVTLSFDPISPLCTRSLRSTSPVCTTCRGRKSSELGWPRKRGWLYSNVNLSGLQKNTDSLKFCWVSCRECRCVDHSLKNYRNSSQTGRLLLACTSPCECDGDIILYCEVTYSFSTYLRFTKTLAEQSNEEQLKLFYEPAKRFEIIGQCDGDLESIACYVA